MSTAAAFKYARVLPLCAEDISSLLPAAYSFVANLTLAQIMAFYWNLETFTLTFTGTAADSGSGESVNATGTFTLSPAASTLFTRMSGNASAMHGSSFSNVLLASCPAVRVPRARVCNPNASGVGRSRILDVLPDAGSSSTGFFAEYGFFVGTDPINADKYRLYYLMFSEFQSGGTHAAKIRWDNRSSIVGWTAVTNGTISIGGVTLSWYSYRQGTSSTGGTLACASTSFTY